LPETAFTAEQTSSSDTSKKGCAGFSPVALAAMLSLSLMLIIKKK